jgi:ribose transport system substrate-binding protein
MRSKRARDEDVECIANYPRASRLAQTRATRTYSSRLVPINALMPLTPESSANLNLTGLRKVCPSLAQNRWKHFVDAWVQVHCEVMKKLRFLVSLHTRENDFQVAQAQIAEATAHKLKSDVEIVFADNDAVNQSTQLLKAIQNRVESRPDAIVVEPFGGTALPQVARAASAAGIGWAVLNRRPDYLSDLRKAATAPMFALSSNHSEIGRIQGRQFAALLPRGGSVLYIEGPSQSSSAQERESGMLETKPPNIEVKMLKAHWTEESALRAVRSWLKMATSQSASISLVGAQDDSMALGARKAFQEITNEAERSRWLSLPFTGCDGQPATGQAWVREKWLTATIHIPPLTGQAMEILAKANQDGTQPPELAFTTSFSIPPFESLVLRNP